MPPSTLDDFQTGSHADVIHFACQACALPLTVPALLAGVAGPCPGCGQVIVAPHPLPQWCVDTSTQDTTNSMTAPRRAQVPVAGLTALPTAGSASRLSGIGLALRSPTVRICLYLTVLAAAPVYFGITRPDDLLRRSVAVQQPRPAPSLEQRTATSVAPQDLEPGAINAAPRFSAASRPLVKDKGYIETDAAER